MWASFLFSPRYFLMYYFDDVPDGVMKSAQAIVHLFLHQLLYSNVTDSNKQKVFVIIPYINRSFLGAKLSVMAVLWPICCHSHFVLAKVVPFKQFLAQSKHTYFFQIKIFVVDVTNSTSIHLLPFRMQPHWRPCRALFSLKNLTLSQKSFCRR